MQQLSAHELARDEITIEPTSISGSLAVLVNNYTVCNPSPSKMKNQEENYRIGYWISEKKSKKFDQIEFVDVCRSYGMEPIPIDLTLPLDQQGPFTLILHKLTDVIAKANAGDDHSRSVIEAFEVYLRDNPSVIMVDPLENILCLLDRTRTYSLIGRSQLSQEEVLCTPTFAELTAVDQKKNVAKLRAAQVTFPIICKPTVAHGSKLAHQMALIFNEEGLKDVNPPCVAQSFINHDAVLYKLYVVGEKWDCVERPSLKNFYPGDIKTIFFDSHSVSKADSDSSLNKLDKKDRGRPVHKPSTEKLQQIVSTVQEALGMDLFGVDVVIDIGTGQYAIVDINAFPGYDGATDFPQTLASYMLGKITKRQQTLCSCPPDLTAEGATIIDGTEIDKPMPMPCDEGICTDPAAASTQVTDNVDQQRHLETSPSTGSIEDRIKALAATDSSQEDSGIDTGDSSDERKNRRGVATPGKVVRRFHSKGGTASPSAISIAELPLSGIEQSPLT